MASHLHCHVHPLYFCCQCSCLASVKQDGYDKSLYLQSGYSSGCRNQNNLFGGLGLG